MKFNKVLDGLKTYEAGKPIELVVREYGIKSEDVIKLASNENPRGCSPKVIKALQDEANRVHLYPDDSMYELKDSLAKRFNVKSSNIIIGAGSDQVIDFAIKSKANENNSMLMAKTTFAMYEIYGRQTGTKILKTNSHTHNFAVSSDGEIRIGNNMIKIKENLEEIKRAYKEWKDKSKRANVIKISFE